MWILRRMKTFELDIENICDTYVKEIRSLTSKQSNDIERVQKVVFIILGENYLNYDVACTLMNIEPLSIRREQLCLKFAEKNVMQDDSLFNKITQPIKTRSKAKVVVEPKCNFNRFRTSSIPYLSRLLNKNA